MRTATKLFIGTKAVEGFAHATIGSVAGRVVRLFAIPVLTVRPRPAA